jgi:hypothetical protein
MMIRWNHKTKNKADEADRGLDNAMVISGFDAGICNARVQPAAVTASDAGKGQCDMAVITGLDSEVYQGEVQLQITPFESFSQIKKYRKYLAEIKDLKVVSESWSEDEGFSIIVEALVPLALGRLLRDIPEVECVQLNAKKTSHGGQKQSCKKMLVVMKTPEVSLKPMPA